MSIRWRHIILERLATVPSDFSIPNITHTHAHVHTHTQLFSPWLPPFPPSECVFLHCKLSYQRAFLWTWCQPQWASLQKGLPQLFPAPCPLPPVLQGSGTSVDFNVNQHRPYTKPLFVYSSGFISLAAIKYPNLKQLGEGKYLFGLQFQVTVSH